MGYALETFIYLPFNLKFIFFLVSSLALAYIVSTYHVFFENFPSKYIILIACVVLLTVDVVAGFIHKSNPDLANKREYKTRPSLVIFVEIVMLILSVICISSSASKRLLIFINALRLWKICYCYTMTSNIVGQASLPALLAKFCILGILIVHSFACIWYMMMLHEEANKIASWRVLVKSSKVISSSKKDVWQWYTVCVYFVTNTFTTIGFGDIVGKTDMEKMLSLVIMVVGYISVTGLFLAAFTTFLTLKYRYYADYKQRRSLIHRAFEEDFFPSKNTTDSIKLFYDRFWQEDEGILHSELIQKLPSKIQEMVSYDIYKDALNACPLLEDLPIAVKKTLSQYVTKQIFLPGWKIIGKETWIDTYHYINYGVAQVLTDEDDESSVFAVGLGSCIGASALVLGRPSKVHVNAATYCITHELKRSDLFNVLKHYTGTNHLVINRFKKTMAGVAMRMEIRQREKTSGLKILKDNLDDLMKGITRSKEMVWYSEQEVEIKSQFDPKDLTDVCRQLMHMNYIPAVETEEIMKDDACIKTEFPWVLEPNSPFLKFWGYLVVSTALLASLLIPYFAAFYRDIPQQVGLIFTYINIVYVLDLAFVCITAQEMPGGRVSKSKEILKLKVKGVYFIVDVIGSLPLDLFTIFFDFNTGRRMRPLLKLNQLIGMVKVHKFFTRMENGFEVNLLALRIIKYILYFSITSYWLGSIYYSMACFNLPCNSDSWFVSLVDDDYQSIPVKVRHKFPFEISIYFGLLVITQTAFGDISAHNVTEMIVLLIFCFVGTFLFCYLISDYSSTLTLQGSYKQEFIQFMSIMTRILENNKMPNALKFRVFNFMYLQWQHRQGYTVLHEEGIMWDLPVRLKTNMKIEHTHRELKSVPLLAALGDEFVNELSLLVEIFMIPPNEVMAYAGSVCNEFYLIEEGNCQMIDGKNKVVRIIQAQEYFNLFEMIVGIRSIYNVKTATHCRVVLITKEQIDKVMNLLNIISVREQLEVMVRDMHANPEMKKLKIHKAVKMSEMVEELTPSGFLFTAGHRAHPNIDYLEPFNHFGFLSGMRFILMPVTINPNGPFMWWWEVFRGLCAFVSSMIFPILPYVLIFYPKFKWLAYTLDLSAWLDLYLRLHICYYNENGLLVLHPLSTAIHYFRSGFIIDLVAVLPFNYFIPYHPYPQRPGFNWINDPMDLIRCNRLLQMHRLISWFVYQEKQILRKTVFITFSKYFLISIVFLNTLAAWLEILTVNFIYNPVTKEVDWQMLKNKHSWIYTYNPNFQLSSLDSILNLHIIAYYWTASVALSIGPGDISAQNGNEMFFVCGVVVLGFLFYTYVLVIIANAKASIDLNLTIYQERMQSLVGFMRNEDVSRDLQKLAIQHFERVWQRTRGVALNSMFTKFTITLREDCLLQIYEQTFLSVPVFEGIRSAFFRELAVLVKELYYIKGEAVVRQNDVISSVLIVHNGLVNVIDCVGIKVKELHPGSIFGNLLYNCPAIRCNVSFIADKNADILKIPVKDFFRIAAKQPKIIDRLGNDTYDGMTFVAAKFIDTTIDGDIIQPKEEKIKDDDEESLFEVQSEKKTFMYWIINISTIVHGSFLTGVDIIFNLISVVLCSYDLAFQSEPLFIPIYILEAIFIITMIFRFFKSYEDPNTGEMVSDVRKIAVKYVKEPTGFMLDFFVNLPIGLILKYTVSHYAMTWANVTHLLRLIRVFKFIEVRSDRLNVKVVYIKVLVILITFTLLAHIFACFWNVVHCQRNICLIQECDNNYLCALYYTVVTLTSTGYGDMGPHTRIEYLYVVMIIIGSRFVFAIFLGDITNAIQTYNYSFLTYEFQLAMLKKYLHVNGVSTSVHRHVIDYCTRLWQGNNGEQIPVFFKQANRCLQQDLSTEIYGKHFSQSFLFVGLHKDLLRQIICTCNQSIYHPGDVVTHENQVDDKMYVIHKGFIISETSTSSQVMVLGQKDFFGVPQGLFHDTPHTRTYTAISVCVILELCLSDWEYLLDFFPASKIELYDRAKRLEQLCEDLDEGDEPRLSAASLTSSTLFEINHL